MTHCCRFGTACLGAVIAAGGMASSVAAPPGTASLNATESHTRAADAVFARPKADSPVVTPNTTGTAYVRSADSGSAAPNSAMPDLSFVRPQQAGWIAVAGAFQRQGSYELAGDAVRLGELIERCGGLTAEASGRFRLVRGGRPAGLVEHDDLLLHPGDLLIAERQDDGSSHDRIDCELAIIGLTERPLVVRVPADYATVEGMLELTGQTHLNPGDVTVLVGGRETTPGDRTGELPDSSVLVFDPFEVDAEAVASHPPRTNYFAATPAAAGPPAMPDQPRATITRVAAADPSPSSLAAPTDDAPASAAQATPNPFAVEPGTLSVDPQPPADTQPPAGIALAPPTANAAPSATAEENLAPLPPEMLDPPPGEPELRFPRVADRSGAVPIGPPETDSHIVPVPEDAFYPADPLPAGEGATESSVQESTTEPAETVAPIDLSGAAESDKQDELPFGDLLPTLVLGAVLGGLTFLTLRWLRRRTSAAAARRKRKSLSKPAGDDQPADRPELRLVHLDAPPTASEHATPDDEPPSPPPVFTVTPGPAGPAAGDLLAALVADRLIRREEAVALPLTLHLHGRSAALRKQRLDTAMTIPEPHLSLAATPDESQRSETMPAARDHEIGDRRNTDRRRRIDLPLAAAAEAALATGTPFERALAARHQAQQRGDA